RPYHMNARLYGRISFFEKAVCLREDSGDVQPLSPEAGTDSRMTPDRAESPRHLLSDHPAKRTSKRQPPLPLVAPAVGEPEVLAAPAALAPRLRVVSRRRVVVVHPVELQDRVRHAAPAEIAAAPEPLPELDEPGVLDAVLLGVGEVLLPHPRPPGDEG